MCSNCSGDYENPDMWDWEDVPDNESDREATEEEVDEAMRLENRRELDKALRNYAASVKRYGKALVDLGRSCDSGKEAA